MNRIFALSVVGVVLAFVPARADDGVKPRIVPVEILKTKHFAVQVKVNGMGPYRVIFDTGAPITLLNNRIAREAKLTPVVGQPPQLPIFGMRGEMNVKSLELGELKANNITVVVMDHPALTAISKVLGPVDGILGFPFFSQYRMTIDYRAETLSFVPVAYRPVNVMGDMMSMMMALMQDPTKKPAPRVHSPGGLFGFRVDKDVNDGRDGVDVKDVFAGTPAAAAGLRAGDRLLVFDGTWTDTLEDCYRAAAGVKPGQKAKLKVLRDGREMEIEITPKAGV